MLRLFIYICIYIYICTYIYIYIYSVYISYIHLIYIYVIDVHVWQHDLLVFFMSIAPLWLLQPRCLSQTCGCPMMSLAMPVGSMKNRWDWDGINGERLPKSFQICVYHRISPTKPWFNMVSGVLNIRKGLAHQSIRSIAAPKKWSIWRNMLVSWGKHVQQ